MIGKITEQISIPDFSEIKKSLAQYRLRNVCNSPIDSYKAYKNSAKFAIVRDPIERFMSAHDMIFSMPHYRAAMERKTGATLTQENSIDTLIEYLLRTTIPDAHFLPQSYFISGIDVNCKIKLGKDNIVDTLANCGLGGWINGFVDQKINESKKSQVLLNAKQSKFLNDYYEADYRLLGS